MHILLIHQYFKEADVIGGARFNEMTRIWIEQGHQVTVLAGDLEGQSSQKRTEYKVNLLPKNGKVIRQCFAVMYRNHITKTF